MKLNSLNNQGYFFPFLQLYLFSVQQYIKIYFKAIRKRPSTLPGFCYLNAYLFSFYLRQLMFDTFDFPPINVAISSMLSLLASGRFTRIALNRVMESRSHAQCIHIYRSDALTHAIPRMNQVGDDFTHWLNILRARLFVHHISVALK